MIRSVKSVIDLLCSRPICYEEHIEPQTWRTGTMNPRSQNVRCPPSPPGQAGEGRGEEAPWVVACRCNAHRAFTVGRLSKRLSPACRRFVLVAVFAAHALRAATCYAAD